MSDLKQRSGTGLLFIVVMSLSIMLHELSTLLLFGLIVFLGSCELSRLMQGERDFVGSGLQVLFFGSISFTLIESLPFWLIPFSASVAIVIPSLFNQRNDTIYVSFLSMALLTIPFALLTYLPSSGGSRFTLLTYFILLWTNDTFAYMSGRTFGNRKLWERLSPKKTWEGFVGGVIACITFSLMIGPHAGWRTLDCVIIASLISIFGTLGDLLESSLKRKAHIKDSGTLMPGHGGILDRFDGVMLSAPFVVTYLWLSGSINLP